MAPQTLESHGLALSISRLHFSYFHTLHFSLNRSISQIVHSMKPTLSFSYLERVTLKLHLLAPKNNQNLLFDIWTFKALLERNIPTQCPVSKIRDPLHCNLSRRWMGSKWRHCMFAKMWQPASFTLGPPCTVCCTVQLHWYCSASNHQQDLVSIKMIANVGLMFKLLKKIFNKW